MYLHIRNIRKTYTTYTKKEGAFLQEVMRMSYDKNRNYEHLSITTEAIEVYKRWRAQKRVHTGVHYISEFFIELLEKDMYDMRIEKDYTVSAYPNVRGAIPKKHAECLDIINNRWKLNEISDDVFDNMKIPLSDFTSIIEKVFGYVNEKTINREKKKLFSILKMKQIRKGNDWLVVSQFYEDPELKLDEYIKTKESINKRVELILQIIEDNKGISPAELQKYIGDDTEVKKMLNKSKRIKFDELHNKFIPLTPFEKQMIGGLAR